MGGGGDAGSEVFGGAEVGGGDAFVSLVHVGLDHQAAVAADSVEVFEAAFAGVVSAVEIEADPDHVVLHGEGLEGAEGGGFVAEVGAGDGEAGGDFVGPAFVEPDFGGFVLEFGEFGADVAHVGGGAEDDGVGGAEGIPVDFGEVEGLDGGSGDGLGSFCDAFGDGLGVAVSGGEHDGDGDVSCHCN